MALSLELLLLFSLFSHSTLSRFFYFSFFFNAFFVSTPKSLFSHSIGLTAFGGLYPCAALWNLPWRRTSMTGGAPKFHYLYWSVLNALAKIIYSLSQKRCWLTVRSYCCPLSPVSVNSTHFIAFSLTNLSHISIFAFSYLETSLENHTLRCFSILLRFFSFISSSFVLLLILLLENWRTLSRK